MIDPTTILAAAKEQLPLMRFQADQILTVLQESKNAYERQILASLLRRYEDVAGQLEYVIIPHYEKNHD